MKRFLFSLAMLFSFASTINAGTTFFYGTTTDPTGKQVDKYSITVEGPTMFLGVSFLPLDVPQPSPWKTASVYLLSKDGTAVGGGHGYLLSVGTFGSTQGGIAPPPAGDYDVYFTSYANKAFDAAGNSLFGGLSNPAEPLYPLSLNPDAGPLDHFALDGSSPGGVVLGDYQIIFITDVAVPEPASDLLLSIGIAGMAGYTWRRVRPNTR